MTKKADVETGEDRKGQWIFASSMYTDCSSLYMGKNDEKQQGINNECWISYIIWFERLYDWLCSDWTSQ